MRLVYTRLTDCQDTDTVTRILWDLMGLVLNNLQCPHFLHFFTVSLVHRSLCTLHLRTVATLLTFRDESNAARIA